MLSFLLICLTCVTAEAILGAKPETKAKPETYTKCEDVVPDQIWKDVNKYHCKAISTASGEWCCNQCNVGKVCPPTGDNDCDCEVIPDPKPKVTCPADFPLCQSDGYCSTHVGARLHKMTPPCTDTYIRAKCTQKFPSCYKDGDCVVEECKNGVQDGTNCEEWNRGHNYISLIFREGEDKVHCSDDYFAEVYDERGEINLDSVARRPSDNPNVTDLVACNPPQWNSAVEFCKNMCNNFFNCGGFTIDHERNQIMLKRIVLKKPSVVNDSVFEHDEYFRGRAKFTTYYMKTPRSKSQTTSELRELFA